MTNMWSEYPQRYSDWVECVVAFDEMQAERDELLEKLKPVSRRPLTCAELPVAGDKYEYKGELYTVLNGLVQSKHPDTGEWYQSVEYCDPDTIYNRDSLSFISKFKNVGRI